MSFKFRNLIDMKKNNDFLSDFSVSDDILYNFNPERYKFYVKFVEGLSDPETLEKLFYKNTEIKYNKEARDDVIRKLMKNLKKLYEGMPEDKVNKTNEILVSRIKNILHTKLEHNEPANDIIKNTFKGGDDGDELKIPVIKKPLNEFNKLIDNILEENETEDNKIGQIRAVISNIEDNPVMNIKSLDINLNDRLIFIGVTFILRYLTIIIIGWCLNNNIINTFFYCYVYYCVIYIIFFCFMIMIVNLIYFVPVFQLYTDDNIITLSSIFYYFYINSNGAGRLILHITLISFMMLIPFVISNKQNLSDYNETNISYDYNKINNISNTISYFSLFMWILTSIVALKF
jgi:hypothetical protein